MSWFVIPEGVSLILDFKKQFVNVQKKVIMGEVCSQEVGLFQELK